MSSFRIREIPPEVHHDAVFRVHRQSITGHVSGGIKASQGKVVVRCRDQVGTNEALVLLVIRQGVTSPIVAHHVQVRRNGQSTVRAVFEHFTNMALATIVESFVLQFGRFEAFLLNRHFSGEHIRLGSNSGETHLNVNNKFLPIGLSLGHDDLVDVDYGQVVVSVQILVQAIVQFDKLLWPEIHVEIVVNQIIERLNVGLFTGESELSPLDQPL